MLHSVVRVASCRDGVWRELRRFKRSVGDRWCGRKCVSGSWQVPRTQDSMSAIEMLLMNLYQSCMVDFSLKCCACFWLRDFILRLNHCLAK